MVSARFRSSGPSVRTLIERVQSLSRGESREALAARLGAVLLASVRESFSTGQSPTGSRWAPLKQRRGAPLVRTGALARSISLSVSAESVVLTASAPYAATHQFGASVRRSKRTVTIPARPFFLDDRLSGELRAQLRRASRAFFGG